MASVCLNFISDYLEKCGTVSFYSNEDSVTKRINIIEKLIDKIFSPILGDKLNLLRLDDLCMSNLMTGSIFNTDLREACAKLSGNNLTYLPTLLTNSDTLKQISPFTFLTSFIRLFTLCVKLKPNENSHLSKYILNNSYLKSYFNLLIKSKDNSKKLYFQTRHESFFALSYLKLATTTYDLQSDNNNDYSKNLDEKRFFYLIGFSLILNVKTGDEFLVNELLTNIFFNLNLWSIYFENDNLKDQFEQLSISEHSLLKVFDNLKLNEDQIEVSYLNSGKNETIKISKNFLRNMENVHIYECLNQIRYVYLEDGNLLSSKCLEHSKRINGTTPMTPNTLFLSVLYSNKSICDPSWIYEPILSHLRQKTVKSTNDQIKITSIICNSLKFVYLLEMYYGDYLDLHIETTLRYVYLLFVYLFDSDVFLDKQILTYLYLIYLKFSGDKKKPLENLKLDLKIPGLMSFYDFYQYLLSHYDATSFGDYVFSLYLIVPLQMSYHVKYRQLFWSDYFHLFKYIRFDSETTKLLISIKEFVQPNETSLLMIRLYSQILLDPTDFEFVSKSRFAYAILISHLNSFIFEHLNNLERQVEFDFKKLILNRIFTLGNEKLKHDLIYLKSINTYNNEIEFFDDLPNIRKQWLNKIKI